MSALSKFLKRHIGILSGMEDEVLFHQSKPVIQSFHKGHGKEVSWHNNPPSLQARCKPTYLGHKLIDGVLRALFRVE